jgi:hypothetical protein
MNIKKLFSSYGEEYDGKNFSEIPFRIRIGVITTFIFLIGLIIFSLWLMIHSIDRYQLINNILFIIASLVFIIMSVIRVRKKEWSSFFSGM